ncbi:MAG: pitrilysin family protein [Patescibacteria group bacterium]
MSFAPKVVDINGLRVILVKDDRESVVVQTLVGTGSREEADGVAGSAHFLEHFVFKGTKKFPGMFDISDAIDAVGGGRNAFTSNQVVGFWAKTAKHKLDLAVKVVGQLVTEPILPEEHFDKERGTILEELKMYEDQPDSKAGEEMWKLLYGKTNMGRPVIGTKKSLLAMTPAALHKYMDRWFVPENMLVGVVGNWGNDKELLKLIEKEFVGLFDRKGLPKKNIFSWGKMAGLKTKLISRKTEQANLAMGLPGLPIGHPIRYASYLTNIIFGGGGLSRLFKEVREKRGWAYSIGSGTESFSDSGAVVVGGGLPKDKLKDAVELIVDIMAGLGGSGRWGITEKDLAIAKECYKGRVSLAYDDPKKVMDFALNEMMFEGKIYPPEEIKANADKVTLEEIRDYCQRIFKPEKLSLAVVGDYEKLPFEI